MDLNHLRYFFEVAKAGGFTRASRVVHVQQPSVSRAVQKLEESLGVKLFERHKRRVHLTRIGGEIYTACTRIFQEAENIRTLADSERNECRGHLRFAATSTIASGLVPRVHESFLRQHPDVWPATFAGPAGDMFERIRSGELEFGIFFYTPSLPPSLATTPLAEVPFALVISAAHASDRRVRASFIGSREVDDPGTRTYPTLDRLRRDLPEAKIRISSNDATAHRELVLAGLGVSILPRFLVEAELVSGRLKELYKQERFRFPLALVTRRDQILSRVATLYLEELSLALAGPRRRS